MKHLNLYVPVFMLLSASAAHSFLPDPPITLSEHIRMSDYIFVARAVDVYYVSSYGKRITPEQAAKEMNSRGVAPWIETKLRVGETLLTRKGRLPSYIYHRHFLIGASYMQEDARSAGLTRMLEDSKDYDGKPFIYFANSEKRPGRAIFFASYGMTTGKEMSERAKVKAAIEDSTDSMRLLN